MLYMYSNKSRYYNRKKKKNGNKKRPTQTFEKKVLSVIHKQAENKQIPAQIVRNTRITNQLTDNILQVVKLTPNIVQGSGEGERVGNSVTTRKAMLYFSAHLFQINNASNSDPPKYLDIYIYKFKPSNDQSAITLSNFLNLGSSSTLYDSLNVPESGAFPVNNDKFTLKKHIRKLLWNPNTNNTYALASRHIMNACAFKMDITPYLKKTLMYNDGVTNLVTNDNLYISCVYTNNDDQQYAANTVVGEFDTLMTYEFEDL